MAPGAIARKNGFPYFRPVHPRRRLLVRMDTTNHCNLRCSMCPMSLSDSDPSRNWHHMEQKIFTKISGEVFPLARTVGISCGAEPLSNPDFIKHLKALYRSGVPYRQMVTNGTLLSEELIQRMMEFPPTSLFISIDGADPDTHSAIRGGADLNRIIRMIKLLAGIRGKRRFPMIGFSTTLQKDNYRELTGIVELAYETGAESCGIVPLVPYEGLGTLGSIVDLTSPEVHAAVNEADERALALGIAFQKPRETSRSSAHPCPYLDNTVYIDPDGSVYPCPYWNTEHPVGSIMDGFMGIWTGRTYERLRKGEFHSEDNCLNCPEVTGRNEEVRKGRQ